MEEDDESDRSGGLGLTSVGSLLMVTDELLTGPDRRNCMFEVEL